MHTTQMTTNISPNLKALTPMRAMVRGVLTTAEQNELAAKGMNFQILTNGEVFWFSDDAKRGACALAHLGFKRISNPCPHFVSARRTLPSKIIQTAESYINVFLRKQQQLTSIEQVAEYLDQVTA